MKSISFFIFSIALVFLLGSCDKDDLRVDELCPDCAFTCLSDTDDNIITNDCTNNTTCDFEIYPNSKLKIEDRAILGIQDGDRTVLLLSVYNDPNPNIADEESTIKLGLELPADQTSFSLDDDQLKDINLRSQRVCFCGEIPVNAVNKGCIQGEKQSDGTWVVQGNLKIIYWADEEMDLKFETKFTE